MPVYDGDKTVLDVADMPVSANTKAVLLADIHVKGYINVPRPDGGKCLIGYPGSTEMCSASESLDKVVPLIRVSKTAATVEAEVPLTIRPFIARKVRTEAELDQLIIDVTAVASQHPVVPVEFDRSLTQTVTRLHAALDPQRAVIRCYPLPNDKTVTLRTTDKDGDQIDLGMEHFVSSRFQVKEGMTPKETAMTVELESVALALLTRGEKDGHNIINEFIESRKKAFNVRD